MNMTKNKVTLAEALMLLEKEALNGDYEIEYTDADKVASTDAIKIGALGIDVPEERIYYDDTLTADDDDFKGEWVKIDSDIEDYKQHLTIQLKVDQEVEEWLSSSRIDLDALVSELITGFYKSAKTIEKKNVAKNG